MANRFTQYIRGDQHAPGERKLVQKLDFFILTFWYEHIPSGLTPTL